MIVGKMIDGQAVLTTVVDKKSEPQPDDVIYRGGEFYRVIGGRHVQTVLLQQDEIVPPPLGDLLQSMVDMVGGIFPHYQPEPITLQYKHVPVNQMSLPTWAEIDLAEAVDAWPEMEPPQP